MALIIQGCNFASLRRSVATVAIQNNEENKGWIASASLRNDDHGYIANAGALSPCFAAKSSSGTMDFFSIFLSSFFPTFPA